MRLFKLLGASVAVAAIMTAGTAEAAKRYQIKSGLIKYQTSQGAEELYWDDFGEREARYTDSTVTVFGMTKSTKTVDIIDGRWAYSYEPGAATASKVDYELMMERMAGEKSQQPRDFSEQMLKAFGGEKIGTDTIVGKKATIYNLTSFGDYKVWVYKGLPLKAEMNMMGFQYQSEAVEIKENARVDQAKFQLPAGIKIVETDIDEMPTSEDIQEARDAMKEIQNDPEMQEAMRQMQELQNNPEAMEAMRQMQDFTGSAEYQRALQQAQGAQQAQGHTQPPSESETLVEDVGEIIKDETGSAVKSTIRDTTRDVIGGGLKSLFKN